MMKRRVAGVILACFSFLVAGSYSWARVGENSKNIGAKLDAYFKVGTTYVGISTLATGLKEPWEITWGPRGWIWMTEHGGTVTKINARTGKQIVMLRLQNVFEGTTPGMLGMAIEPDQKKLPYVFLLYNSKNNKDKIILNLVRYTVHERGLSNPKRLLQTPSAEGHVGARVKISPDGNKLFITDGDAEKGANAQDVRSLNGKVLRININGSVPKDNPFRGSPVWAWGLRSQEGLTFGENGILYGSMNGPASDDEINIIRKAGNYGWPKVNGYCDKPDEMQFCKEHHLQKPLKVWTPTIAPAGLAYYNSAKIPQWKNSLLLTTLKDASLHVLSLDQSGKAIKAEHVYLKNAYGRLRDVCVSPQGDIYISTSNRDWNPASGFPKPRDDRIIRLSRIDNEEKLKGVVSIDAVISSSRQVAQRNLSRGAIIYSGYCKSCHKADGKGVNGSFPPLSQSKIVNGSRKELIPIILEGLAKPIQVNGVAYHGHMPSFRALSDKEIAQVLTFIRSNFGNNSSKVSQVLVKRMRAKEAPAKQSYSQ